MNVIQWIDHLNTDKKDDLVKVLNIVQKVDIDVIINKVHDGFR